MGLPIVSSVLSYTTYVVPKAIFVTLVYLDAFLHDIIDSSIKYTTIPRVIIPVMAVKPNCYFLVPLVSDLMVS